MQLAAVPGLPNLLQARAPAGHDWERTAAVVAPQAWWFKAFRADDVVANVRRELAFELAAAKDDAALRQQAWAVLGRLEPRLLAERHVLEALEQLVATRGVLWDPRLDEVAEATAALRAFWRAAAPALVATPEAAATMVPRLAPAPALAERVRDVLTRGETMPFSDELAQARQRVGPSDTRWLALQLTWHRVGPVCAAVRDHAAAAAARTKAPDRQAAYAELARRCGDVAAALEVLRGR